MAASLALGGIGGCAYQPAESIVPYVQAPEAIVPGQAALFHVGRARSMGLPAVCWSRARWDDRSRSRVTPTIPASLGATDVFGQATLLGALRPRPLADGDPQRAGRHLGALPDRSPSTSATQLRASKGRRAAHPHPDGRLADTGRSTGPAAANSSPRRNGTLRAADARRRPRGLSARFRRRLEPVHHLDRADVIVVARRGLPGVGPAGSRMRAAFAARREAGDGQATGPMNRLYVVECRPDAHRRRGRSPAGRAGRAMSLYSHRPSPRCGRRPGQSQHTVSGPARRTCRLDHRASRTTWTPTEARAWLLPARRSRPEVHALAH